MSDLLTSGYVLVPTALMYFGAAFWLSGRRARSRVGAVGVGVGVVYFVGMGMGVLFVGLS